MVRFVLFVAFECHITCHGYLEKHDENSQNAKIRKIYFEDNFSYIMLRKRIKKIADSESWHKNTPGTVSKSNQIDWNIIYSDRGTYYRTIIIEVLYSWSKKSRIAPL
jgi:hypothetical protein